MGAIGGPMLLRVSVPEHDEGSVASLVEAHEAAVWARCFELVAAPPDPLGAVVDRSGPVPLPSLTAVDSTSFNRVVGLGVGTPATPADVERIADHYRRLGQRNFRVELAPVASPPDLARWLEEAGLHRVDEQMTKVWRPLDNMGDVDDAEHGEVRRLTAAEADDVSGLNLRAWGAWQSNVSLRPWFAAPVGRDEFTHYGAFVDGRLVCTGALAVNDRLAWIGFDATHPRHRSRQLRRALTWRRLVDARTAGCTLVHAEGRTDRLSGRSRLLDTLYVRQLFDHGDAQAEPRVVGPRPPHAGSS